MTSSEIEVILICMEDKLKVSAQKSHLIYRSMQELINNSLKHAKCKTVFLKIEKQMNQLKFVVEDDGIGIEVNQTHNGLKTIKERIQLLNGEMKIEGIRNEGTTVEITLTP